jgi:predicted AAA+ superfamily ATPase
MFVRRIIEPKVEKDFFKGKVIVLLGVRQVGKKTFVRNLELCVNHDTL